MPGTCTIRIPMLGPRRALVWRLSFSCPGVKVSHGKWAVTFLPEAQAASSLAGGTRGKHGTSAAHRLKDHCPSTLTRNQSVLIWAQDMAQARIPVCSQHAAPSLARGLHGLVWTTGVLGTDNRTLKTGHQAPPWLIPPSSQGHSPWKGRPFRPEALFRGPP